MSNSASSGPSWMLPSNQAAEIANGRTLNFFLALHLWFVIELKVENFGSGY